MKKAANTTSIRVFCRLRPLNRLEREQGGECCVHHTDSQIKVKVNGVDNPYDFNFDGIFGHESAQIDVFNKVAQPVIHGLMDGYNGTIFAYGQTSSGKTFTMEGPDNVESDADLGIIPRMQRYLFNLIMESSEDIEFQVKVSFLELYNEKLQDLLDPRKNNLQIKEDKSKGIFVQDATEIYVSSAEQMHQIHKSGFENKTTAATRMNERSSRSHAIFILYLSQKNIKTETTKQSKLYFVDLAGSEKIAKTNVTGQQLEEAKNINKSLTALGLVINALTDKDKGHVPYRDSKLTRLLQESLGGNSQTSLILACSMCSYNDRETVDTLRFGNRAKSIKNTPIVNAERSAKELQILLSAAEKRILEQETLINGLQAQIGGGPIVNIPAALPQVEVKPEIVEVKPEVEVQPVVEEKPVAAAQKPAGSATNSLALLKTQLELEKLNDQVEELRATNKELETDASTKNKEIYDLNGKVLQYESQISELTAKVAQYESQITEFTSKNVNVIEEYQVQFEKLYHENQEKNMMATKFKRAIVRLKADLNFVTISKHLKALEGHEQTSLETTANTEKETSSIISKDDLIVASIQKTIEMLEEIEKDIDEGEKKLTSGEEMENLIDALMKNSPNNSMLKDSSSKSNGLRTDLLVPGADDELKGITWMTDSSGENKDNMDMLDNLKLEGDNEVEEFMTKMQNQSMIGQSMMEDDKSMELQSLVSNQRKTISNLTKLNNELTQANQKYQAAQEKNVQTYKQKLEEFQKINAERVKEYEAKIQSLKSVLEVKINEVDTTKSTYEKYLLEKAQMVSDLKQQNDILQGLISGNDTAVRTYELENTVKEIMIERKKLAEEILKMRKEGDDKDDIIAKKTSQVELLQNNLGLAAKEIKMLKQFKPANVEVNPQKPEAKERKHGQKHKNEFTLFDRHVVMPIRGGGGDAQNFARNNNLAFDAPSRADGPGADKKGHSVDRRSAAMGPKTPKTGLFSFGDDSKASSSKMKDEQNFKKFDNILKQKGNGKTASGRVDTDIQEDDDDEVNMEEVQQKLKHLSGKSSTAKNIKNVAQTGVKSLISGVKNLFS